MSPKERTPKPDPASPGEPGADPETPSAVQEPAALPAYRSDEDRREGRGDGLQDAWRAYAESLRNAYDEESRSAVSSWGEYLHQLQDAQIEAQKRSLNAYRSYLKAVNDCLGAENAAEVLLDEEIRYARELEAAWGPEGLERRFQDAAREYWDALQGGNNRWLQDLEKAWRSFLRALRDAWADMEMDTVDQATTASLGYGLLAAAQMEGSLRSLSAQRA